MRRIALVTMLLLLVATAFAAPAGDKIIADMKRRFSAINDYKADVTLTVKGPRISINNMQMTVYYKKPDRIHVDAKQGFAMVPSGNYFGDPLGEFAASGARATYVRSEKKQGRDCYVVRIDGPQTPVLLWVDKQRSVIVAMEAQRGFATTWQYAKVDGKYYLPTEIRAEVQVPGMPAGHGRRPRANAPDGVAGTTELTRVTVKFSNYKVNKGIDDKIFQEKRRK